MAVDGIVVRRCTEQDAQTLALVGAATFLDAFAGTLPGRSIVEHCRAHHTTESYSRYLALSRCRIWLAETQVQLGAVGYSMLTAPDLPIADPQPDDIELKRIYLLTRFHGGGTGQQLMNAAIEGALELHARRLFLGVYAENKRALAFYRRMGFQVAGRRTFQMGFDTFDDLVLSRSL